MAYTYQAILEAQYQRLSDEHARLAAALEAARVDEDAFTVSEVADRILSLDQQRAALETRANNFVAGQQPQGNKYGLSRDEIDIAHGISSGDASLTNDERERTYLHNKQRLRAMRRSGEYADHQGLVRR